MSVNCFRNRGEIRNGEVKAVSLWVQVEKFQRYLGMGGKQRLDQPASWLPHDHKGPKAKGWGAGIARGQAYPACRGVIEFPRKVEPI